MGHEGMKSSLVSREIIADSIELMVRAHQYDALVGIAGCDKSFAWNYDGNGKTQHSIGICLWWNDYARNA